MESVDLFKSALVCATIVLSALSLLAEGAVGGGSSSMNAVDSSSNGITYTDSDQCSAEHQVKYQASHGPFSFTHFK